MNLTILNHKRLIAHGLAVALAMSAWLPATALAADQTKPMKPMKAGEHQMMLHKLETQGQADVLTPADTIAMVCAKCKTVTVSRVKRGMKGAEVLMAGGQSKELIGTHACPGCKSMLTITGHGKGKEAVLKHSCGACGDDSAFCCATSPGSGVSHDAGKHETGTK